MRFAAFILAVLALLFPSALAGKGPKVTNKVFFDIEIDGKVRSV